MKEKQSSAHETRLQNERLYREVSEIRREQAARIQRDSGRSAHTVHTARHSNIQTKPR